MSAHRLQKGLQLDHQKFELRPKPLTWEDIQCPPVGGKEWSSFEPEEKPAQESSDEFVAEPGLEDSSGQ
jgi:hypothetical protein